MDTKTILAIGGLGAAAYLFWPRDKAKAAGQPLDPTPDPEDPNNSDPVVIQDPLVTPPPPKKPAPRPQPKFYPLAKWSEPGPDEAHGIPLKGSNLVGSGSDQEDGVTYFEWRLYKTPITFTCAGALEICAYVFETRGVRRGLWETLTMSQVSTHKNPAGWSYDAPEATVMEMHRLEHEADFEKEKELFG